MDNEWVTKRFIILAPYLVKLNLLCNKFRCVVKIRVAYLLRFNYMYSILELLFVFKVVDPLSIEIDREKDPTLKSLCYRQPKRCI